MKKNTVVIGAGLAGLSAAYHLKETGVSVRIFESSDRPGGLSSSSQKFGFTFDKTGHFLHFKEDYAKQFVSGLIGEDLLSVKRNAGIVINGQMIDYPFQVNFPQMNNKTVVKECEDGLKTKKERENYGSFKDWILGTYGEGIARHFMFPYNSKLWAYDLDGMLFAGTSSYIPDTKTKKDSYGYNAEFYYPKTGGIGKIAEALAQKAGKVEYGSEVKRIHAASKSLIVRDNIIIQYDRLISTAPMPELIKMTGDAPLNVKKAAEALKYTAVFALNLGIKRSNVSDRHWIYVPEEKYLFYRVGFYSNVSDKLCPPGTSSLYVETAYSAKDGIDEEKAAERMKKDLVASGILKSDDKIIAEERLNIPYAYVVFDHERKRNTDTIFSWLTENGISTIGRYGAWDYSAMEDAIMDGKYVAEDYTGA